MPDFTNNAIKLGGVISQRPPFRPPPNIWRTVSITFDDVPSGTAVDSTYASSGVNFASVTYPPRTWSAFAKEMPVGGSAQSGKNVLTIIEADPSNPWFDARYGALEATFSQLQQSVSVWAYAMNSPEGSGNADSNAAELSLTQDLIAVMLGVRRSTVSIAAGTLQKAGIIRYHHGKITVVDRVGLENAACECYEAVAGEYRALFGEHAPDTKLAPHP